MATQEIENDFIAFLLAAEKDEKLLEGFLKQNTSDNLYTFFQGTPFKISKNDCEGIIKVQNEKKEVLKMTGKFIIKAADCPDKGY